MATDNIVVGLDIGTSKIAVIIGNTWQGDPEKIEIRGVGTAPSRGLRRGIVVDMELTTAAIREAVSAAELMSGVQIGSAHVGIAGGHIMGQTSHGIVAVSGEGHEITQSDVDRAINAAKAVAIPADREEIMSLRQRFKVDNQDGIKDPIGMSGVRLEAYVHIITGAVGAVKNLTTCVNDAGMAVESVVLEPIASAESVLNSEEKLIGVALADIGGGTTDTVVYKDGALRHTEVLSIGGDNLTHDIAQLLKMTPDDAIQLKHLKGCALVEMVDPSETIQIPTVGGLHRPQFVPREFLAEIVQCRMEETLNLIYQEIKKSGVDVPAGLVLTGGTSLMNGMVELAEPVFPCPVRVGYPRPLKGLIDKVNSPVYATGVGLVMLGSQNHHMTDGRSFIKGEDRFNQILSQMKNWFSDYF